MALFGCSKFINVGEAWLGGFGCNGMEGNVSTSCMTWIWNINYWRNRRHELVDHIYLSTNARIQLWMHEFEFRPDNLQLSKNFSEDSVTSDR